jgi:hypothetical protein
MTTHQEISKPKDEVVYKFSNRGRGQLKEASIIKGKPYFIKYEEKGFITTEPKITDVTPALRPPVAEEYPYNPYEFRTVSEPQEYLVRAMRETPDSLLAKIKTMVKDLNDISEHTANLLSLTIFNSYFQDRFSTVYYLIVIGANGTGKSAFGDTFESLAYRAVKVTNATDTFWFRIFGTIEFGQVTIIAEEFDKMDESGQTMAVIKDGYQPNIKVPRMTNDNSKMEFFCPFGIKIIIAEKSPSEWKARGVLDRSFKNKTYKGFPKYKIKEIRNPQGNPERQKKFDEMEDLRKLMFMYRLIHIKDPYKEINVGLHGRDEELCKPTLQLLYTLGATEDTIKMAESTFQHFLDIKNDRKKDLLEATIYPIVKHMVSPDKLSIPGSEIWDKIAEALYGKSDEKDPNLYHSEVFGDIYRITITKMICDKFGAEVDHKMKGNNLLFDYEHLTKMGEIYKNVGKVKTEPVLDDSMTGHIRGGDSDTESNHDEPDSENDDSRGSHVQQVKNVESSNHSTENVKCPYCDHEDHPFFLKIHRKMAHEGGL